MRRISIIICFVASLAAGGACGEVRVGIITDLTGPYSQYGQQTAIGAHLAEKELASAGKNLRVVVEDSSLKTMQAASAAQKLFEMDDVDALYVDFAVTSIAAAPIARARGKVAVYAASIRSVLVDNPFAFRTYVDYLDACSELARAFSAANIERVGVLKVEAEYGDLCLEGVRQVYRDAAVEGYKQKDNVQSQLLRFKSRDVRGVINAAYEMDIISMLQGARNIGYSPIFGAPEEGITAEALRNFNEVARKMFLFSMPEVSKELIEKVISVPGGESLRSFERAGTLVVHLEQLYEAVASCPGKSSQCISEKFAMAGPDERIGFEGWKGRSAVFSVRVRRPEKFNSDGKPQS